MEGAPATRPSIGPDTVQQTIERLTAKHAGQEERIRRGVEQVAQRWWPEDGDAEAFAAFCEQSFLADPDGARRRLPADRDLQEQIDGRIHEIRREVLTPIDLDTGEISPLDRLFADFDLAPHIDDDLFKTKVAFFALLNFPVHTLAGAAGAGGRLGPRDLGALADDGPVRPAPARGRGPGGHPRARSRRSTTSPATTSGWTACSAPQQTESASSPKGCG